MVTRHCKTDESFMAVIHLRSGVINSRRRTKHQHTLVITHRRSACGIRYPLDCKSDALATAYAHGD